MSERSRSLPRRSVHLVPGSNDRFLERAPLLGADAYVLDLEDSVAKSEKAAARDRVVSAIKNGSWGASILSVRINEWPSKLASDDLEALLAGGGSRIDTVVLPKVGSPRDVVSAAESLSAIEARSELAPETVGIEVLIESAGGLVAVNDILRASHRVESVIFGQIDFSASIGVLTLSIGQPPPRVVDDALAKVRMDLLIAGRAAGCAVVDGPYVSLDDNDGLVRAARESADLGLDGKWSIHPSQIEVLNAAFTPSQQAFDQACALIQRLSGPGEGTSRGAARYEGAMIDEATRKLAASIVRRGELAGRTRSG